MIDKVSPKTKILFSVLFPVLLVCWNQGFDVGAFGTVLYRNAISAWIFVISAFIALCYVAFVDKVPVKKISFFILVFPILWPLVDYLDHHFHNHYLHYFIIFDYVIIVFGLMYAAYLFIRLVKPDVFDPLSLRNKLFIISLGFLFSVTGFLAGSYNDLFLECGHFEISGDYLPHNCRTPVHKESDFRTLHRKIW